MLTRVYMSATSRCRPSVIFSHRTLSLPQLSLGQNCPLTPSVLSFGPYELWLVFKPGKNKSSVPVTLTLVANRLLVSVHAHRLHHALLHYPELQTARWAL